MLASRRGHTGVVKKFIIVGLHVHISETYYKQALEAALKRGHTEVADLLRATSALANQ